MSAAPSPVIYTDHRSKPERVTDEYKRDADISYALARVCGWKEGPMLMRDNNSDCALVRLRGFKAGWTKFDYQQSQLTFILLGKFNVERQFTGPDGITFLHMTSQQHVTIPYIDDISKSEALGLITLWKQGIIKPPSIPLFKDQPHGHRAPPTSERVSRSAT